MSDLFSAAAEQDTSSLPLAARLRPRTLDEYIGQSHLLADGKPLREAIARGRPHSMIFWGPPGVGKTTLAKLLATSVDYAFVTLSAVLSGVKDIRDAVAQAKERRAMRGQGTILFVDEVHRFNKSQQDAFLPHVEDGTIIFVGATTENPSFELNNALLSRCRVYKLQALGEEELGTLVDAALSDPRGLHDVTLNAGARTLLLRSADGDGRKVLNLLEVAADFAQAGQISEAVLADVLQGDVRRFDKGGDLFYDQLSAFHKSVRGSSPDGALYWMARMLDGGCDPFVILRRMVAIASEDIGNADPRALEIALNAWHAQERLGMPEGLLALGHAVVYLAAAPKSNAVYNAIKAAIADVKQNPSAEVPLHLRNAPTELMKDMGHGEGYRYAHDEEDGYAAGESYFPEDFADREYYVPVQRGLEIKIKEKLERLKLLDQQSTNKRYS